MNRSTQASAATKEKAIKKLDSMNIKLENPDYQKFYRSIANVRASTKTREYAKYISGIDVHSEDKLRVNRVVVSCDEFYRAFGITEKRRNVDGTRGQD